MNLLNINLQLKKKFPANYLFFISQLRKTEGPEEKARIYIGLCTLVFFSFGLSYDTVSYLLTGTYLLANVNTASLLMFWTLAFLFRREKISVCTALTWLFFTVQTNVVVSIIYNCAYVIGSNNFIIYHDLYIGFLVCILAALTIRRGKVHILCILPLTALGIGLSISSPVSLIEFFPSLCLAYASPPVFLARIRVYLWNSLREKEQLLKEKQAMCKLMGMNEQQWDLLIDTVQIPRVSKEQTQELFDTLQNAISDQLVVKAKQLMASEEQVEQINRKKGLRLTAREVQLCGLIVEGKSVAEISAILHVMKSSVRAYRTHLRKKLKLAPENDLKVFLIQLITEEMNKN